MLIANVDSSEIRVISMSDNLGKARTFKDIANMRFSKLVAIQPYFAAHGSEGERAYRDSHKLKKKRTELWECQCDCGNTTVAQYDNLIWGHVTSCGCVRHVAPQKQPKKYQRIQVKMTRDDGSVYELPGVVFLEGTSRQSQTH